MLAAQAAIAQLRNNWNRRAGNATDAIPREIWAHIMGLMPLPDRMVVLRTSRGLRDIALAHPIVWSSGDVTNVATLQFIRKWSGSAPLDLHIFAANGSDPLLHEICDDAERIRRLRIKIARHQGSSQLPDVDKYFTRDISTLEHFSIEYSTGPAYRTQPVITLPIALAVLAPRLKSLMIGVPVNIPDNVRPLRQVLHFAVLLTGTASRERLFTLVPNVQSLSLSSGLGVLPLGPPPRSLVHLRLKAVPFGRPQTPRDNEQPLDQWDGHALDSFEMEIERNKRIQFALALFARSWPADRPFELDFSFNPRQTTVGFRQKLNISATAIDCDMATAALGSAGASSSTWENMSTLSLDRHALLAVIRAGLVLPSVTDLKMVFDVLSAQYERNLMSIDWREQLTNKEAGKPRTLSLPSLRRVFVLEQISAGSHSIAPTSQSSETALIAALSLEYGVPLPVNDSYGHEPVPSDTARRVHLVAKLGPQILKHHIDYGSSGREFKLEIIRISIARKTKEHSLTMGVDLTRGYEGLAHACTVEAKNVDDNAVIFGLVTVPYATAVRRTCRLVIM